jgi:hypothetical protein
MLGALAPYLPAEMLNAALDAARAISNDWDRVRTLVALAPRLSSADRPGVLTEALKVPAHSAAIGTGRRRYQIGLLRSGVYMARNSQTWKMASE